MMKFGVVAFVAAALVTTGAACGPLPPEAKPSKLWSSKDFVASARQDKTFGFIPSRLLGVESGEVIPWRSAPFEFTQSTSQGVKNSALPSPAPSRWNLGCCSTTSPPARSTRR